MSYQIYTGVWTDWSRGAYLGATLTLGPRHAGFLLAFVAILITIIAARLWRLLSFALHQALAAGGDHDGLYHQRQHILRNSTSPLAAVLLFLQQAWYWRGVADNSLMRTVPWAAFALLYVVVFGSLAMSSSQLSHAASEFRLVRPANCGLAVPVGEDALQEKSTIDNLEASMYSRQCYQGSSSPSCGLLPTVSISWTNSSVDCPFKKAVCLDTPAFQMKTETIDSHVHLGINEPDENRITYGRETTCSPLVTQPDFAEYVDASEAKALGWHHGTVIKYLYGPLPDSNYTHLYNTLGQKMKVGYAAWTYYALADSKDNIWQPIDALNVSNSDISLILIAPNSISHLKPNSDPIFAASAGNKANGIDGILPDQHISAIACADKHQICNPAKNLCTPFQNSAEVMLSSAAPDLSLNSKQLATVQRLGFEISVSSFYHLVFTRTQSFLRAQERLSGLVQLALPEDQWKIEMGALFTDALSKLQLQALEYATGASAPGNVSVVKVWASPSNHLTNLDSEILAAHRDMCGKQRVRFTQGTVNFSIPGLALLLVAWTLITFSSFFLELVLGLARTRFRWGFWTKRRWEEHDEGLVVMKMKFVTRAVIPTGKDAEKAPHSLTKVRFEYDEDYLAWLDDKQQRRTTVFRGADNPDDLVVVNPGKMN